MTEKVIHQTTRWAWVYLNCNQHIGAIELSIWMSPDKSGLRFEDQTTPFSYRLTRAEVVYEIRSQVQLEITTAIEVAKLLYENEFAISPRNIKKAQRSR